MSSSLMGEMSLIPLNPALPLPPPSNPWNLRLRRITTSEELDVATTIPLVPATRTDATWPPPPSMVMDLVIVSAPNPPGSKASISPPGAVLEIAPANVLQGAVRLQGFASSPTPDTQVRVAWALISVVPNKTIARAPSKLILRMLIFLLVLLSKFRPRVYRNAESRWANCGAG